MTDNTSPIRYTGADGKFIEGNPGKPKGARHLTTKIMDAIVKVSEGGQEPEDVQLVKKLLEKAKDGDMQAMKLIFNYVDGMPVQGLEIGGPEGGPIQVKTTVTFVRPDGN